MASTVAVLADVGAEQGGRSSVCYHRSEDCLRRERMYRQMRVSVDALDRECPRARRCAKCWPQEQAA